MLRTKFKNLRRPARAQKTGITVEPYPKKRKTAVDVFTESEDAEYKRHIEYLKQTYKSKKWSLSGMLILLEQTSKQRRSWIQVDCPPVKEILDVFPCLANSQIVCCDNILLSCNNEIPILACIVSTQMVQEFCKLTGLEKEVIKARWLSFQKRIFMYAPLETKKAVTLIVHEMEMTPCDDEGGLQILIF